MAERTSGIYNLVTRPLPYKIMQNTLGGVLSRNETRNEFVSDIGNKTVLELGCGPCKWINTLFAYGSYLGLDWNAKHVNEANQKPFDWSLVLGFYIISITNKQKKC